MKSVGSARAAWRACRRPKLNWSRQVFQLLDSSAAYIQRHAQRRGR